MKKYLLDTNICVYFLNGKFNIEEKIVEVGFENCFISEITIAELKYGVEKSTYKEKNRKTIEFFNKNLIFYQFFLYLIYMQRKKRV